VCVWGETIRRSLTGIPVLYYLQSYATWCGFCKRMMPVWEDLAGVAQAENLEVRIAKVNAVEEPGKRSPPFLPHNTISPEADLATVT